MTTIANLTLVPFLDALDVTRLPPVHERLGQQIFTRIAPSLLAGLETLGLVIEVAHDLSPILEMQRSNLDMLLCETINPKFQPIVSPEDLIVVNVRERSGLSVACGALRRIWVEGTLKDRFLDKLFLVPDPRRMLPPDQAYRIAAGNALDIKDCDIAWSCGHYVVKKFRETELHAATSRLLHLLGFCSWHWSHMAGRSVESIADRVAFGSMGWTRSEWAITRYRGETAERTWRLMSIRRAEFADRLHDPVYADPYARFVHVPFAVDPLSVLQKDD